MSVTDRVAVQISADAAPALVQLTAVKSAVTGLSGQQAKLTVNADISPAQREIAVLRNETAALRAQKAGIVVTADTAQASQSIQQINLSTQKLNAMVAKTRVEADTTQATAQLGALNNTVGGTRAAVQGLEGDITNVGTAFAKMTTPAALVGGIAVITAAAASLQNLETEIQNNTGMTNGAVAQMDQGLRTLAADSNASFASLGEGYMHVANFAFQGADATKVMTAAMESATSTGADTANTANVLASALHQYKMNADEALPVANLFHIAAQQGNETFDQFANNAQRAISLGANLNIPIEQVTAALSALTKNGFTADEAQTQLVASLTHIIKPSQQAQAELERLTKLTGVDLVTAFSAPGLAAQGYSGVLADLQSAYQKLGYTQDQATQETMKLLNAQRGGLGVAALLGHGYQDYTNDVQLFSAAVRGEATPVQDAYGRSTQTLTYQVGELRNQFRLAASDAGGNFLGPVTGLVTAFNNLGPGVKEAGVDVALMAVGLKAASLAADFLTSSATKLGASVTGDTAAMVAETAAMDANTTSLAANAAARDAASTASAGGASKAAGLITSAAPGAAALLVGEAARNIIPALTRGDVKDALIQSLLHNPAGPLAIFTAGLDVAGYNLSSAPQRGVVGQDTLGPPLPPGYNDGTDRASTDPAVLAAQQEQQDAQTQAATDLAQSLSDQAATYAAMGASGGLIQTALYGKDYGDTAVQIAAAKRDLTSLTDAFKSAETEVGKVDLSKGYDALVKEAPALDKAVATISKLGQVPSSLADLTAIADQFANIAKQEDAASASYDGYAAAISQTDQYQSKLDAFKKTYDAAIATAETAVANGTATDADRQLLQEAPTVLANIAEQTAKIGEHNVQDALSLSRVVPDWNAFDNTTRNVVNNLGGNKELGVKVTADTQTAQNAIDAILNPNPRELTIDVTWNYTNAGPPGAPGGASDSGAQPWVGGAPGGSGAAGSIPIPITNGSYPGVGADATGSGPGGFNQYRSLSQSDYLSIVRSSEAGKSNGPFEDPTIYAAVLAAAKQYGVDPRALLAFTKNENNDAINISPDLNMANNFGGIKFAGQTGATKGPVSPEGDNYAAFNTPQDFFAALARNLSTGIYADAYKAGDLTSVRRDYVVGGAGPGTPAQERNVANTVNDYNQWAAMYPAAQGAGGPGSSSAVVNAAMKDVGVQAFIDQCEAWVETKVQEATGVRGATGKNEPSATSAFNDAASMGLVTKDPQPGDLVYYPDASGDGHVAIYMGGGQQISTWDARGNTSAIHTESVGAGAQYVRSPGNTTGAFGTGAAAVGNFFGQSAPQSGASAVSQFFSPGGAGNSTLDYTKGGNSAYSASPFLDLTNKLQVLSGLISDLGGKGAADLNKFAETAVTAETTLAKQAMTPLGPNGTFTQAQQQQATNEGIQQGTNLAIAMGRAMLDIKNHTGDVAADLQRVSDLGGVIGPNLAQQVSDWGQIATATAAIVTDQQRTTDLENAHTATLASRQQADTTTTRANQERDWRTQASQMSRQMAQQDTQYQWTLDSQRLDDKKTQEQRGYDDATTAENRRHQLADRNLTAELTAMQRLQVTADSGNSATEQSLASQMANGSGSAKFQAGELLSIQKDFDSRNRQTMIDNIASIKDQQVAENNLNQDTIYNLNQQHTTATRNYADDATTADRNHQILQRQWQEDATIQQLNAFRQTQNDTRTQWALADQRQREDAIYTAQKAGDDLQTKIDTDKQKRLTDQATATNDVLANWEKVSGYAGGTANSLLAALPQLTDAISNLSVVLSGGSSGGGTRRLGGSTGLARGA